MGLCRSKILLILVAGIVVIIALAAGSYLFPTKFCVPPGGIGSPFNHQNCCPGLVALPHVFPDASEPSGCSPLSLDGTFICGICGGGFCGLGANECNCLEDCGK